jgi:DNA-binding NtrC family response regulator
VDPEAQRRLLHYDWPGNIRELQNVLERAMLLAEQDVIGPEHLPADVRPVSRAPSSAPASGAEPEWPMRSLEDLEREHVQRVLAAVRGNRETAAQVLGISRRTLTRMIQRWNLPRH